MYVGKNLRSRGVWTDICLFTTKAFPKMWCMCQHLWKYNIVLINCFYEILTWIISSIDYHIIIRKILESCTNPRKGFSLVKKSLFFTFGQNFGLGGGWGKNLKNFVEKVSPYLFRNIKQDFFWNFFDFFENSFFLQFKQK